MLKRTPFKSKQKPLKRVSLKKRNEKAILEDRSKDISDWDKDREFYLQIWGSRPHMCYESNAYLGSEPLSTYFNHVLPKELYPQFRHEEWNIVLMKWELHDQWHLDREKCPKTYTLYLELLNKHINFE